MDPVLRELLLERLDAAPSTPRPNASSRSRRTPGDRPDTAREATPVWLKSVTVEGFRGIGPQATLELEPAPGLTVVVGRNGSGKSSFAEGLELLMTGQLKRWEKRPKAWSETWQCLHHDGPTKLTAELQLEGQRHRHARSRPGRTAPATATSRTARQAARAARGARLGARPARRSGRSSPTPSWRRCSTR